MRLLYNLSKEEKDSGKVRQAGTSRVTSGGGARGEEKRRHQTHKEGEKEQRGGQGTATLSSTRPGCFHAPNKTRAEVVVGGGGGWLVGWWWKWWRW